MLVVPAMLGFAVGGCGSSSTSASDAGCNAGCDAGYDAGSGVTVNGMVSYLNTAASPTSPSNYYAAADVSVLLTDAFLVQTSVKTDATGSFSVGNVAPPYSVAVTVANTTQPGTMTTTVFLGLSRTNPALVPTASVLQPFENNQATLNTTVTGGAYPQPATDYTTSFCFVSPQAQQSYLLTGDAGATNSLVVSWSDADSGVTTGTLYGLQIESDATGLPVSYAGYGTTSASVENVAVTNVSLELSAVGSGLLTGAVTVPQGYQFVGVAGYLNPTSTASLTLFMDSTQPNTFSYVTPSIADATLTLVGFAATPAVYWLASAIGFPANASGVSLDCSGPPTLLGPAENDTAVTNDTQFSWSAYPNGIYEFALTNDQFDSVYIWTANTNLTISELTSVIPKLSPSTRYTWSVSAISPWPSVDAMTAPQTTTGPPTVYCQVMGLAQALTTSSTP